MNVLVNVNVNVNESEVAEACKHRNHAIEQGLSVIGRLSLGNVEHAADIEDRRALHLSAAPVFPAASAMFKGIDIDVRRS